MSTRNLTKSILTFAVVAMATLALGLPSASALDITYDFDTGPDDGANPQGWTDVMGVSFPASAIFGNGGNFGGRGTGGSANGTGNQDSSHPTLIMRSPAFSLTATSDIEFQLTGGQGSGNTYATSAAVPAGNSIGGNGQQKFYLRRESDDAYLLNQRRSGNGNSYQTFNWDSATLGAATLGDAANETYTLDWVDNYNGGWGFGMLDDVVLTNIADPASAVVPEPASIAIWSILGICLAGYGYRRRRQR